MRLGKATCAVVTGAGRGLGRALAVALAGPGASVALVGRDGTALGRTAEVIAAAGGRPVVCAGDLGVRREGEQVVERIRAALPRVDLLVNNAAGWLAGRLEDCDPDGIDEVVRVTVTGTLLLTRGLLGALRGSDHPRIVNVASTAALPGADPANSSVAFVAAKYGLVGFGRALAAEVRPAGVMVTTVYPGAFGADAEPDAIGPLTVGDVVEAVLFCASRRRGVCIAELVITPAGDG